MHELPTTQSVVDVVTKRTGTARVATVRVGRLAGVVPDAMRFCFEVVTSGTPFDGAALEIDQPEGEGPCRSRGADPVLPDAGTADSAQRPGALTARTPR